MHAHGPFFRAIRSGFFGLEDGVADACFLESMSDEQTGEAGADDENMWLRHDCRCYDVLKSKCSMLLREQVSSGQVGVPTECGPRIRSLRYMH